MRSCLRTTKGEEFWHEEAEKPPFAHTKMIDGAVRHFLYDGIWGIELHRQYHLYTERV